MRQDGRVISRSDPHWTRARRNDRWPVEDPPASRASVTVRREAGPWTPTIHAYLRHLRASGFTAAPEVLGLDERGREILRSEARMKGPGVSEAGAVGARSPHVMKSLDNRTAPPIQSGKALFSGFSD